jgi:hypothetical protein
MDVLAATSSNSPSSKPVTPERHHLLSINTNLSLGIRITSSGAVKRSECSEDSLSPIQNKRHKNENQSPTSPSIFSMNRPQALRKTVSIMNVLTSSSEMLRKNRL